MTETSRSPRPRPVAIGAAWQAFWFHREPAYTLGLVRIAFGALAVVWTLWLLPIRDDMLGPDGVTPTQPAFAYNWGIFQLWPSNEAILVAWALLVVAAVALTVGWHSRIAAIMVFVLILSFQHRNQWVFNAGDGVVRLEALFVALSPCGAALSLDQRRRAGSFWSAQIRPIWPIRLMQVQLSIIYLASVQTKLSGETWLNGTAVSYALRLTDMQRLPVPHWFVTNALLINVVTWGTLGIELAVGVLVWNRRLRAWVLLAGVAMHLIIDITIQVGIFSYAMLVLYLAWIPPKTAQQFPGNLMSASKKLRAVVSRRSAGPTTGSPWRPADASDNYIRTRADHNATDACTHPAAELNGHPTTAAVSPTRATRAPAIRHPRPTSHRTGR